MCWLSFCQLDISSGRLRRGTLSWESPSIWLAYRQVCGAFYWLRINREELRETVEVAIPGQVVLEAKCVSLRNKPVGSVLIWSLLSFLPCLSSCVQFYQWWSVIRTYKPFPNRLLSVMAFLTIGSKVKTVIDLHRQGQGRPKTYVAFYFLPHPFWIQWGLYFAIHSGALSKCLQFVNTSSKSHVEHIRHLRTCHGSLLSWPCPSPPNPDDCSWFLSLYRFSGSHAYRLTQYTLVWILELHTQNSLFMFLCEWSLTSFLCRAPLWCLNAPRLVNPVGYRRATGLLGRPEQSPKVLVCRTLCEEFCCRRARAC